jgi:hypothetical protein
MRRAAEAGDSPYAVLGKLHYASALHEGKGVPKDEAAARRWFEAAAAEGNPDAIEFLRTGYHVGDRDGSTRGVGVPPPVQASPLPGELQEQAARPVGAWARRRARRLSQTPASPPLPRQRCRRRMRLTKPGLSSRSGPAACARWPAPRAGGSARRARPMQPAAGLLAVLLAAFAAGALGQALQGRRVAPSPVLSGA